MNRIPDPAVSRAILIGSGSFTQRSQLPAIPAVKRNLTSLAAVLADGVTGSISASRCQVVLDPEHPLDVGDPLGLAARDATDLLLVYYVGHGILDERGQLYLALGKTDRETLPYSALSFDLLRREIADSPAAVRVLILDCCFSGRAIEALTGETFATDGQLRVAGTYTLSSTTANAPSHAPTGEDYTAFTGALLRALQEPEPLTLNEISRKVDGDLRAAGRPRPQWRAVNTAGDILLSRGSGQREPAGPVGQFDKACFRRSREKMLSSWRTGWVIGDGFGTVASVFLAFTMTWWVASVVGLLTLLATVLTGAVWNTVPSAPDELVISPSGILFTQGNGNKYFFAWHHVSAVGVMAPIIPNLSSPTKLRPAPPPRPGPFVLAVRLRPQAPDPDAHLDLLTKDHNKLGYFGVCRLDTLDAGREDINAALERFAGARALRSAREFLDADPRLRPDMV